VSFYSLPDVRLIVQLKNDSFVVYFIGHWTEWILLSGHDGFRQKAGQRRLNLLSWQGATGAGFEFGRQVLPPGLHSRQGLLVIRHATLHDRTKEGTVFDYLNMTVAPSSHLNRSPIQ